VHVGRCSALQVTVLLTNGQGYGTTGVSITFRPERVTGVVERSVDSARQLDAVAVAVLAVAVSAAGAARPSLWFDEAATISASTRTVPELWRMVGNIDAVHGLYYLIMHGWFTVFPATEFWSRLPSSLAVGVAAAGVVVLGRQLSNRSVAVAAGVIFALLPRVTWAGIEARSYALSMVVGVWLTLLCVAAAQRNRLWWWVSYAALVGAGMLLNVFVVLIVGVHAVLVAVLSDSKRVRVCWAMATFAAVAMVTPFLLFTQTQLFQVGWISPLGATTVGKILQEQYFDHSLPVAVLAGLMIASGVLCRSRAAEVAGPHPGRLVAITASWILIPTAALLVYSAVHHPIYYPRYLSFTAPAIALLLGLCVVAAGRSRPAIAALLMLFAFAATPNYLEQRGPYAKEGMDYSQVADVITRYAKPGDCLVMDNSAGWKPGPIRPLIAARPAAFDKLHDYGRGMSAIQRNRLWDAHVPVWTWADKMPGCPAIWTVSERDKALPDHQQGPMVPTGPRLARAMAYQVPSRFGFRVVERWQFSFAQVTKSTR
jgi:mannosyltransferase